MLQRAIAEGGATLLDHLASEIAARRDESDGWLDDIALNLARAAKRLEEQAPDVAMRVKTTVDLLMPRTRAKRVAQLNWVIDSLEDGEWGS